MNDNGLNGIPKWFGQKRLGAFIHWGVYAVGEKHEQGLWRYRTPWPQYLDYVRRFAAPDFDPRRWLDFLQENGFEYLVFTTKHHDGFCMFDSSFTDFKVTNTPFGRDVFGLLAEECHKRSFPLVAYYSVVDWHHPAYPNCGGHHELFTDPARHNLAEYAGYLRSQIRELCTNYGTIHGIWWDMNTATLEDSSINAMIRELHGKNLTNTRGARDTNLTSLILSPLNIRGCKSPLPGFCHNFG